MVRTKLVKIGPPRLATVGTLDKGSTDAAQPVSGAQRIVSIRSQGAHIGKVMIGADATVTKDVAPSPRRLSLGGYSL